MLSVEVRTLEGFDRETFHVRLQNGWRFTIPNEVVEVLELKQGEMLRMTLEREGEDLS